MDTVEHPFLGTSPRWWQTRLFRRFHRTVGVAMLIGGVAFWLRLAGYSLPDWLFLCGGCVTVAGSCYGAVLFATLYAAQRSKT